MISRRALITQSCAVPLYANLGLAAAGDYAADRKTIDDWIIRWMPRTRDVGDPLKVGRFGDRIYYLIGPISWTPSGTQVTAYPAVTARTGFVTDFTSIPRAFWSLLPTDGDYVYAAVLHDYLYWFQQTSRQQADDIFRFIMEEFGINKTTVTIIYQALHAFGGSAWDENARLRRGGEKRILKRFPDRPTITWEQWKKDSQNFE